MTFTSFNFLIFFPIVVILYNILPQKFKLWFLLLASYFFYINLQPVYALLLAGVTLSTYLFTRSINKTKSEKKKHQIMIWGIIITVLPLFFFKYFTFINNSIISLFSEAGIQVAFPEISFMLPVGISFYTFMAIGYIVDVYNEDVEFESSIGSTGLFLSFFPLLLSGPIERAGNMLPQFKKLANSSYEDIVCGSKMMLWGYFMKLCVADTLGMYVDAVFNNVAQHNGTTLALASALYPFQVYADLGGYSLIAIGTARCLGFNVISNFNRPFFATSMAEFWRRWHMSLMQWLTDYIYTPLSFTLRRWKMWGIFAALMFTFLISGLWHGAALAFVVWGAIQGIYLCIDAVMQKSRARFEQTHKLQSRWYWKLICSAVVFVLFAFSQIFGRCANVEEAGTVISKIFTQQGNLFVDTSVMILGAASLFVLVIKDIVDEYKFHFNFLNSKFAVIRYASVIAIISYILLFGVLDGSQFIYFQF